MMAAVLRGLIRLKKKQKPPKKPKPHQQKTPHETMVYSLTNKMLRPVAFQSAHSKAFSSVQTFLNSLEGSKKQVKCSMSWQILCGTRVSFSACGCTTFWWANDSFSLLLFMAKGSAGFFGCEKFWSSLFLQMWGKKMWDMFPRLWHLGVCCQVFSLLLGKIIMFILRGASYTLVIWDAFNKFWNH